MSGRQRVRAVLFYASVLAFFAGIPFILSFALGYKFDRRTYKFTKTGLIVLKTQPAGAGIYMDGRLLNDKTPTSINELLPGKYQFKLELEGHYPYLTDINVEANKVSRLERVILFPLRPDIKKLNKEVISCFWVDEAKDTLYYVDDSENSIYKSDLDGEHFVRLTGFKPIDTVPRKWKLSDDRDSLVYFNSHQIGVLDLSSDNIPEAKRSFVLEYPSSPIIDVFWHSDSFHLVLVSADKIEMLEANPGAAPVTVTALNKKNTNCFYDARTDTLYFLDTQKSADGKLYDNLYKVELNARLSAFRELIKLAPPFEKKEAETK